MSTIVQMPVRVKPPPADTGETISPGCASFEIATPLNGARMTVSSIAVCCRAIWLSATLTCSCADVDARDERIDFGLRVVDVVRRVQAFLAQLLLALQLTRACASRTSLSGICRRALRAARDTA